MFFIHITSESNWENIQALKEMTPANKLNTFATGGDPDKISVFSIPNLTDGCLIQKLKNEVIKAKNVDPYPKGWTNDNVVVLLIEENIPEINWTEYPNEKRELSHPHGKLNQIDIDKISYYKTNNCIPSEYVSVVGLSATGI